MQTYKIVDIMGDFSLLVDFEIEANSEEEAKEIAMNIVKENVDNYMWAVVQKGE